MMTHILLVQSLQLQRSNRRPILCPEEGQGEAFKVKITMAICLNMYC